MSELPTRLTGDGRWPGAEVETARCVLRTWRPEDAPRVLDIYSRWEVSRWLGTHPRAMETLEEAALFVERGRRLNAEQPVARRWAIERKRDRLVLGTILLVPLPEPAWGNDVPAGRFEVGWHLHPGVWGRGYATETAYAALVWGFRHGLTEIFAVARPENTASLNVCRRLGMESLGRTTAYYESVLELFYATPAEQR